MRCSFLMKSKPESKVCVAFGFEIFVTPVTDKDAVMIRQIPIAQTASEYQSAK